MDISLAVKLETKLPRDFKSAEIFSEVENLAHLRDAVTKSPGINSMPAPTPSAQDKCISS